MPEMAYYEAKLAALQEVLRADESVRLIHETFLRLSPHRSLFGEIEKNFAGRVISPPISELGVCGRFEALSETITVSEVAIDGR